MVENSTAAGGDTLTPVQAALRVLHVVVHVGPTNSQWNEHCLPAADVRRITVCSLLPATVAGDPRIVRVEGDGSVPGAVSALRRTLRAREFDVVHVHNPVGIAALFVASTLERHPTSNVVFTLHNTLSNLRFRNRLLALAAFTTFPVVVVCGRSAALALPTAVRRLAGRKVRVVPNGVDVARVDAAIRSLDGAAAARRQTRPGLTVMTVGRLIPIKDQATLMEAFARVARPDDRLVIVGEGELASELSRTAQRLSVGDQVKLAGLIPRDDVYRMLGEADIFVSPSKGEGLPVAVLEAMAAGVPVVLSDIAPHREIVGDRDVAAVVPVGDVEALAAAMARLRDVGAGERARIGAAGRELIVREFSVEAMQQGYERVYAEVSGRTPAPEGEET